MIIRNMCGLVRSQLGTPAASPAVADVPAAVLGHGVSRGKVQRIVVHADRRGVAWQQLRRRHLLPHHAVRAAPDVAAVAGAGGMTFSE